MKIKCGIINLGDNFITLAKKLKFGRVLKMTVAKVKKMKKDEIIELLKNAGVVFSQDLNKADLVKLYEAQQAQVEDYLNEINENEEGAVVEMNEVKNEVVEVEAVEEVVTSENLDLEVAEVEVVESENQENEAADENAPQAAETSENEKADEKPQKAAGRAAGIGVQFFVNDELQDVFPSIQAAAREIKVYLERDTMPYTLIHKSIREHIDYTHTDGQVLAFRFENDEDKKDEYKTRISTSSGSRGAGKLVDWFENGQFVRQFPSIKAAVEHMKDYLKLPHNPYTAVLKSLNENQDFNQHSFEFATEVREAAQAVASDEPQQAAEEAQVEEQEIVEVQDEVVEIQEDEAIEA
jgi:hypothetical protein